MRVRENFQGEHIPENLGVAAVIITSLFFLLTEKEEGRMTRYCCIDATASIKSINASASPALLRNSSLKNGIALFSSESLLRMEAVMRRR